MIQEFLVLALVPAVLVAAAGWDLASFTIPNFLQILLIGGFAVFAFVSGMDLSTIGGHLAAGGIGFLLGFTLFAFGLVGGGDAKLFACVALWFGVRDFASYALIASVFGGALTLAMLAFRQLPLPAPLGRQSWLMRLHDREAGIPYGVALSAGAFAILPYTDVFRAGVAG
ncbi:MAG TPA: prepilin peptidase [Rhizomicrobium sp.]